MVGWVKNRNDRTEMEESGTVDPLGRFGDAAGDNHKGVPGASL